MRSKVDFQMLDGDDDSNDALMKKYNVRGYPTLIYTDSTGKLLSAGGASRTADDFKQQIGQFVR